MQKKKPTRNLKNQADMTPSIIFNPKVMSELDEISDKNSKE